MTLTPQQQVEVLKGELANLEFGKRHYENNRFYKDDLKHKIHMKKYDDAISAKQRAIDKLIKTM